MDSFVKSQESDLQIFKLKIPIHCYIYQYYQNKFDFTELCLRQLQISLLHHQKLLQLNNYYRKTLDGDINDNLTLQDQNNIICLYQFSLCSSTLDIIQGPKKLWQNIFDTIEEEIGQFTVLSSLIDENYFSKLKQEVEQRLKCKVKASVLFVGSKDGLTFNALWNKIQGKQKLLFIFKSQSGSVFGAFTPCKWSQQATYIQDDAAISFIFSATRQEIYPIKNATKSYSSYIEVGSYLIFGGTANWNQDIRFDKNFTDGYSQLGVCYEAQGKDSSKQSTFLFGGLKPNVIECEVFELS